MSKEAMRSNDSNEQKQAGTNIHKRSDKKRI